MCHPQTESLQSCKDDHSPSEGSGVGQRCPQEFKSSKFDISHLMEAKCEAAVDSGIVGVGSTSHTDVDSGVALTCERAPCVDDLQQKVNGSTHRSTKMSFYTFSTIVDRVYHNG